MKLAGYSDTPLAKKLGIKPGSHILIVNKPKHYFTLFADFPDEVVQDQAHELESLDFVHVFCQKLDELESLMPRTKPLLKKTGMLWISWPKGSSKLLTDLKREIVRNYMLRQGFVDIKVCAVDQDWSGLKFIYRTKDRY